MSSEIERFLELGKASNRLIWEIYQSRNRNPREALLILLEHSRVVKDCRKALGLDSKTLDPPIRMLFAEIAKNHSTYLDKDIKMKPHIILDTGFLKRLPPLPPNFQPPYDIRPNEDVSMTGDDDEDHRRAMKRDNTHMSPQSKRSKKKKVHIDDSATRPSSPAEEGVDEPPARATRSRTAKAAGGSKGATAQGRAASKGRAGTKEKGKGKEKEHDGGRKEGEEEGVPVQEEPPAPGSGFELTDEPCALCVFAQQQYCWRPASGCCFRCRKHKRKCSFANTTKGPRTAKTTTTARTTTMTNATTTNAKATTTTNTPAASTTEKNTAPARFGYDNSNTAGPSSKAVESSSKAVGPAGGSGPGGQAYWTVFGLPSGMPAGTAIDTSGFLKGDDLRVIETATHDLQADIYDIRGQLQAKVDIDADLSDRLAELEGGVERVHEDLTTFTSDIEDIRAELQAVRKHFPNNPNEIERISNAIAHIESRVGEQEKQFTAYKQRATDRLGAVVRSTVGVEVKKAAGELQERVGGEWEERFGSLENWVGEIDSRLRELEGQQTSEIERRLEGLISEKVNHVFKEAEGKLEGFVNRTIAKESQRLADSQVNPGQLAKEVSLSLERHWPSLLTPILSTTLQTHLKERIGDVDANIVRIGEGLTLRLRSIVQEEVARISHDIAREAVITTMQNLTVVPPSPDDVSRPYPTFIDPDRFEQAFEPILLSPAQHPPPTSASAIQLRDPNGDLQAGLQESILTAVPDGVSSVRARRPSKRDSDRESEGEDI
ncbi:hypothetical protein CC1G_05592 [Coprinopsis cinerea okayama7|uniref:Uncharacterized protein n=1 Tax=Coprinopsis cinerea (strain Okayama-7 / 130 / ATCC MYA-4618 / FGSC 9003) TaxID=240176 RepID=A8P1J5_COPC7|nr:hypothetical protein CC1G_05592 [Coprinopsis cinerea okayama7\|eukprot:XP_001838111.1 hypothetical protein CC1G_05592 [Coprinopsis cinerea okayama7\